MIVSDAVDNIKTDPTKDEQSPQIRNSMVDIWDSEDIQKAGSTRQKA